MRRVKSAKRCWTFLKNAWTLLAQELWETSERYRGAFVRFFKASCTVEMLAFPEYHAWTRSGKAVQWLQSEKYRYNNRKATFWKRCSSFKKGWLRATPAYEKTALRHELRRNKSAKTIAENPGLQAWNALQQESNIHQKAAARGVSPRSKKNLAVILFSE